MTDLDDFERAVRPFYGRCYNVGDVPACFGVGYASERHWTSPKRWQRSALGVERAMELVRARGPVLDLGCGRGALTRELRRLGETCVGLDITDDGRDGVTAQGSALRMPFKASAFRTIVALDIVEHVPPEFQHLLMWELRRVLAPGGLLLATVPTERPHFVKTFRESGPVNHYVSVEGEEWRAHFWRYGFGEALDHASLVALGPPFSYGETNFPLALRRMEDEA